MSDKNYYHNKGEQDSSKGKYDPPHEGIGGFTTCSDKQIDQNIKDQKDYESGWDNTWHQTHNDDGCFITTATLNALGKSDDCEELNAFRIFRDNWLCKQVNGKELILEYYEIAPQIVKAINSHEDNKVIYKNLWKESLEPCLKLIDLKKFKQAKKIYSKVVRKLKVEFL